MQQHSNRLQSYGSNVEAVRNATAGSADSPVVKLETWSRWALAEADRIDPSVNGRFLKYTNGTEINLG